jgi:hypothetical protein
MKPYAKMLWHRRRSGRPTRSHARAAVVSMAVVFVATQLALAAALEFGPSWLRDPEYGVKESRLDAVFSQTDAPTLAFGSSRLVEGLRPRILGPNPSIYNFGLIGAGPVQQRLALQRLLRHGVRPVTVILEYWPPYWLEFADQREEDRIDRQRLSRRDLPAMSLYVRKPRELVRDLGTACLVPVYSHRFVLMNLALPVWLPFEKRQEFRWRPLDDWGWLPGKDADPDPIARAQRLQQSRQYYEPFLTAADFDRVGVRAFDDLLDDCQSAGIDVIVLWLPESSEFRSWYSPTVERMSQEKLAQYGRRPGVSWIDARAWIADERLGDGFHLDPAGAEELTRRLAESLPRSGAP